MVLEKVEFVGSFPSDSKCPDLGLPEFAFIGRSNVGKSSLINMITDRKQLARVSSTPGRTQMINLFNIDDRWILTDLPGYGYAKISKKHRKSLKEMITNYVKNRKSLVNLFLLLDSRIDHQKVDQEFMRTLGYHGIPFSIVYTKTDKIKGDVSEQIDKIRDQIKEEWEFLPKEFVSSSVKKTGRDELLEYLQELIDMYEGETNE